MQMAASIELFSGVATSRDSNGFTLQFPRGCLTIHQVPGIHYQVRDTIIPFVRSKDSPRAKMI